MADRFEVTIVGTGDAEKVKKAVESYAGDLNSGKDLTVEVATVRHGPDFNPQVDRVFPRRHREPSTAEVKKADAELDAAIKKGEAEAKAGGTAKVGGPSKTAPTPKKAGK